MKLSFALIAFAASTAFGAAVFQSVATDTGSVAVYSANSFLAPVDQIALDGTNRVAADATTQLLKLLFTSGTFDATLNFYEGRVNPGVVGTLLGWYTITNIAIPASDLNNPHRSGTAYVTFSELNLLLPDEVIFALTVANVSNTDLGITLFDPPNGPIF